MGARIEILYSSLDYLLTKTFTYIFALEATISDCLPEQRSSSTLSKVPSTRSHLKAGILEIDVYQASIISERVVKTGSQYLNPIPHGGTLKSKRRRGDNTGGSVTKPTIAELSYTEDFLIFLN